MRILVKVSGNYTNDERVIAFIQRWISREDVRTIDVICGAGFQINKMLKHKFGWEPEYDGEGNRLLKKASDFWKKKSERTIFVSFP